MDALAIDGHVRVVDDLDVSFERAQDGIVLDQVRGLLDTAGVVDGNNFEQGVLASAVPASQKVTADTTKAIDGNLAGFALGFDSVADRRLGDGLVLELTGSLGELRELGSLGGGKSPNSMDPSVNYTTISFFKPFQGRR